jgi:hypothetical protein
MGPLPSTLHKTRQGSTPTTHRTGRGLSRREPSCRAHHACTNGSAANQANRRRCPPPPPVTQYSSNNISLFYWWTHGLSKNPEHTSGSCKSKGEGHSDDATIDDRKGGITNFNFGRSGKARRVNFQG